MAQNKNGAADDHEAATKGDIRQAVDELAVATKKGFDKVDERFDGIDQRFDGIDSRLDKMDDRFDKMDNRFDKMDNRFDKMDDRLNKIESDQKDVLKTVKSIDQHFKEFKTHPVRIARLERSTSR